MKEAVIRIPAEEHRELKKQKRQYGGVSIGWLISAWRYAFERLTPEDRLALLQRKSVEKEQPAPGSS